MASQDMTDYFKIRPFLSKLISNFQQAYTPFKNISIDESMISFKGRISFLQYIPKKPKKCGFKAWALSASKTGYSWNLKLYVGKDDEVNTTDGLAYGVVMEFVKRLAKKVIISTVIISIVAPNCAIISTKRELELVALLELTGVASS